MPRPFRLLALAALACAALGCRSKITGNEGNLSFSYDADDAVGDFNKPIAVGARLDLKVEGLRGESAQLVGASTGDAKILKVAATEGPVIVLEGVAPGSVLVEAEATVAGETLKDSVNMLVREPEVLKLRHFCTAERRAKYLVDQDLLIPFELEMKNGQPVIGYGLRPVESQPAGAIEVKDGGRTQALLHLRTRATPGLATLSSTLDDTSLEFDLVSPASIDGAALEKTQADHTVRAGQKRFLLVRPTAGGAIVCEAKLTLEAASLTPDVCAVSVVQTAREDDALGTSWGWVEVDGQKPGACRFEAKFPQAAGGAGAGATITVQVAAP